MDSREALLYNSTALLKKTGGFGGMITLPLMILAIENDDDRAYITELYLKYRKLMYSVAIEIVRDPHIAEDMVASAVTEMI